MLNWHVLLRKRKGRAAATRTVPLRPGEIAGSKAHVESLLAGAPKLAAPPEGRVVVGEVGKVGVAVEGGMAVPTAGLALRGWMVDPENQIVGVWLDIDGKLLRPRFLKRVHRPDVNERRGLIESNPAYEAGFFLFEEWDFEPGAEVAGYIHAVVRSETGYCVVTSGTKLVAGRNCTLDRLKGEFRAEPLPGGGYDPATGAFFRALAAIAGTGRAPVPLCPGLVPGSEAHLRLLMAKGPGFGAPPEGQIVVGDAGKVALAVEAGMAIPAVGIALRGWLTDPENDVAGLWLEIDGSLHQARLARRSYRHDINEFRGLLHSFPGYRAGFCLFERGDFKRDAAVNVHLHAVVRSGNGYTLVTSGTRLVAGRKCTFDRLIYEIEAGDVPDKIVAEFAQPFLDGLADMASRGLSWEIRFQMLSGRPSELAVVIVVQDNFEMLDHVLAALEVCSSAKRMEVVLALQKPEIEPEVNRWVRMWRSGTPFAAIRLLVPVVPVSFGTAANAGIDFAESPAVAITSDEILPPNGGWVEAALGLLTADRRSVLVPDIATFDHVPFTFARIFELPWAGFEHEHPSIHGAAGLDAIQECLRLGCGVMVASRELLTRLGRLDDKFTFADISLFEFLCRAVVTKKARLVRLPRQFIHLRLGQYDEGLPAVRLWNVHALVGSIQRLMDDSAREGPPEASAEQAAEPVQPQAPPRPRRSRNQPGETAGVMR